MIGVGLALGVIGFGVGFAFWHFTRPKKLIWSAKVYTISDTSKLLCDSEGNPQNITLNDLQPFCKDYLEKIDMEHGREIYRLQKLNKTTPAVGSDHIENWGDSKEVKVLLHNNSCTLLKNGYDGQGNIIFNPVSYDTQNMVRNEISSRKAKIRKEKDILEAIAPYITIGISMIFLFGVIYFFINAMVDINKEFTIQQAEFDKMQIQIAEIMREGLVEYGESQKETAEIYQTNIYDLNLKLQQLDATLTQKINSS